MLRTLALSLVVALTASAAATGVGVVAYRFRAELKEHVLSKVIPADGASDAREHAAEVSGGAGTIPDDEPICVAVVIRTGPRPGN